MLPNKELKLTKPGQIGASQLNSSVGRTSMRIVAMAGGRWPLMIMPTLLLAGCDKMYVARVDVGTPPAPQVAATLLMPEERDRAVALFQKTAAELGLKCEPSKYSLITGSYDLSRYTLSWCQAEGQFTRVQLAQAIDHVSVEVHQIGGGGEPSFFRQCRVRFAEVLQAGLPRGKVFVSYPYRRVRAEGSEHGDLQQRAVQQ